MGLRYGPSCLLCAQSPVLHGYLCAEFPALGREGMDVVISLDGIAGVASADLEQEGGAWSLLPQATPVGLAHDIW